MTLITIIHHGKRNTSHVLNDFIHKAAKEKSFSVHVCYTKFPGHARQLTLSASMSDIIIASGGDGTVNEVVNGIMASENKSVRLIILPAGTGNDFMRTRPRFSSAEELITQILSGKYSKLDIGVISSKNQQYHFLNITDAGFGGSTVHTLDRLRKVLNGKIAYPLAIVKTFIGYKKPIVEVVAEEFSYTGSIFMVAFCNGSCFGNGIHIHPGADPSDGKLNITLLGKVSLFDYLRHLPKLKKGKKIKHPELHYFETTKCSIKLLSGKINMEADGEKVSLPDPQIWILPAAIRYVGPFESNR